MSSFRIFLSEGFLIKCLVQCTLLLIIFLFCVQPLKKKEKKELFTDYMSNIMTSIINIESCHSFIIKKNPSNQLYQ